MPTQLSLSQIWRYLNVSMLIVFASMFVNSTMASTRIALIIGNADYGRFGTLPTPVSDARLMAETLSGLGFQVKQKSNLRRRELKGELTNFLKAARLAEVALVYFSGFHLTLNDKSYLTPVGVAPTSVNDAQLSLVSVEALMRRLSDAASQNVLILEGSWKSPVVANLGGGLEQGAVTSLRSGLIDFTSAEGVQEGRLVTVTSTSKGRLNSGETTAHSGFTSQLAQMLQLPGLQLSEALGITVNAVNAISGGEQTPAIYGALAAPLYMAGQPLVVPEASGKAQLAQQRWAVVRSSNIIEEIQSFLDEFGDTPLAGVAMSRIQSLNAVDPEERRRLRKATIERRALLKAHDAEKTRKDLLLANFNKESVRLKPILAPFNIEGNVAVRASPGSNGGWLGLYKSGDIAQVRGRVLGKNWYQVEWRRDEEGLPIYGYFFAKSAQPQASSAYVVWRAISENPTVESLSVYLQSFPEGFNRFEAVRGILNQKYPSALAARVQAKEQSEEGAIDIKGLSLSASELPTAANTTLQSQTISAPDTGPRTKLIPEMGYHMDLFEEEFITTGFANLRRLPWIKTRKLAEVDRDTKIVVTGKVREENWYRVKWGDGRDLYVHGSNVVPYAGSEFELWQESKSTGEIADLNFYLQYYASGRFAEQARELIRKIRTQQDGVVEDILTPATGLTANLPSGADELINVQPFVFDGRINRSISSSLMQKFGAALKTRVSNQSVTPDKSVLDISGRVIDVKITDAQSSTFLALGRLLGDSDDDKEEKSPLSNYRVLVELSAKVLGESDAIISIREHESDIGPETAQSLAIQITLKKAFDQAANDILQRLSKQR